MNDVTVFGEILWDVFGNEKKIGGAPFNFAANITALGLSADMISAVGNDELGDEALNECTKKHIVKDHIILTEMPTGYCKVELKNAMPVYTLVRNVAYDYIEPAENIDKSRLFYFGTLAQRGELSRKTLRKLLGAGIAEEVFFDINIRQDFYDDEIIDESLKAATILKISREEIGVLGFSGTEEEISRKIMDKYPGLKMVIVTLDRDGAFCAMRGGAIYYSPKPDCNVISTVGAGDAFSAGFVCGLLSGKNINECMKMAGELAGRVCSQLGAVL